MNTIEKRNNIIYIDNSKIDLSIHVYLNKLAHRHFRDINSINKITKKITGYERLNPIYISYGILIVPLSNIDKEDSFCFNYYNVDEIIIDKYETIIIFKDGMEKRVNVSSYKMNNQIKKARIIEAYVRLID